MSWNPDAVAPPHRDVYWREARESSRLLSLSRLAFLAALLVFAAWLLSIGTYPAP